MGKNLVIVESPAKAKTIEKYLGKDFIVMSSYGHVRDLAKGDGSIDIENGFKPKYIISSDKKKIITELKKQVKAVDFVWLASDEDREGEAISWHLKETLGLDKKGYKRITFNEITKSAVLKAIEKPRAIDDDLVNAQQARRILDRLVGFELSPVLWRKVKPSLSAGRVQSVAVRLVVEREQDIEKFTTKSFYRTESVFKVGSSILKAKLNKQFDSQSDVESFLSDSADYAYKVKSITKKPAKKSPAAPFTTSTLQQEASLKLGFSVSRTMSVAQRLYESGLITYMRTDSVNLSETALSGAKNEIEQSYGKEYHKVRKFKNKSGGAQEAHEAIRPTDFTLHSIDAERDEARLYQLIWKRSIASQMSDAQLERTAIKIDAPQGFEFAANGEIVLFDGFLKVYLESKLDDEDDEMEGLLPAMSEGDVLEQTELKSLQRFTRPPSRYVEASLVKKLEELGIGRPSTYAPTISTIQKRGYVERGESEGELRSYKLLSLDAGQIKVDEATEKTGSNKGKMIPTDIGRVVTEFLMEHFGQVMDYNFTANVEKEFDDIANGMVEWTKMIEEFYGPFHKRVEDTIENSERASGERMLGVDPKTGLNVYARIGRYGPMAQIGESDQEEKPKFASLKKDQSIQTITIEEALELFKFPKVIGQYEDMDIKINKGRFGPYVQQAKLFVSIKEENGDTLENMTIERAIELIEEKKEEDRNRIIKSFDEYDTMQLLNGRYGPYLKVGRKNYKLPKDVEPKDLTYDECLHIMENQPAKKRKAKKK